MALTRRDALALGLGALVAGRGAAQGVDAISNSGAIGWCLIDVATGQEFDSLSAGRGFPPASTIKLATAGYALARLRPERRFVTRVTGGQTLGLVGGGDPELDSPGLRDLARAAAPRAGRPARFVVEAGRIADRISPAMPIEAAYDPAISRLSLNYNRVKLLWERDGDALEAWMEAHGDGASPRVSSVGLRLVDCACPVYQYAVTGGREVWTLRRDAMKGRASVMLPVRRPGRYAAETFAIFAREAGLVLPPAQFGAAPAGPVLAERPSRPLVEMLADMLRFSTNLTAETLGVAASGRDALAASARDMAGWAGALAGIDPPALDTHSGLSPEGRISPRAMARLLAAMARARPGGVDPVSLLRPASPPAEGAALRAKTGTLDFARGLAGWLDRPDGRRLAFAIFSEDLARRSAGARGALRWRNRAIERERLMLRLWAG